MLTASEAPQSYAPPVTAQAAATATPSTPSEKRVVSLLVSPPLDYRPDGPTTPRSDHLFVPLSSDHIDENDALEDDEDSDDDAEDWRTAQRAPGELGGMAKMQADAPLHPLNTMFSSGLSLSSSLGAANVPGAEVRAGEAMTRLPDRLLDFERNNLLRKTAGSHVGAKRRSPMTGSPEPPAKMAPSPHVFLKPAKVIPSVERLRQQTMHRSQSEGSAIGHEIPGITPDKVARPTPRAFHSTGMLTKRTGKRLSTVSLPDTPSKRTGAASLEVSSSGAWGVGSSDSGFGSAMHSENESPVSSTKSAKSRTPLDESPLFPNGKTLTLNPAINAGELSPVSPLHPVLFARHSFFSGQKTAFPLPADGEPVHDEDVAMNSPTDRDDEASSFEERDWFSIPDGNDVHLPSLGGSRQPSDISLNNSFSDMSDVLAKDGEGDEEDWRRSSVDRRSEVSSRASAPEPVFTPYPRFLNPDSYDFETGSERGDAAAHRPGDGDYFESVFVVIRTLGKGSSADAYKVQCRQNRGTYAIKKTRHPYNGHKDRSKRLGEVEVMWTVGMHPHCVHLLNAWEQLGHLYLQMELCAGGSLQSYLEEFSGDFDELKVWRTLGEIAQGLEHIHNCEVIHLDIKPANIFITKNWKLKIGDFGLATRLPVKRNVEREGDRIYIAKEILSAHYGKPADIFSLGIMMLEIAANVVLPHFGDDWHKLRNGDFSVVSFGTASFVLQKIIKSMMDPNPERRPTAAEINRHPLLGCWM